MLYCQFQVTELLSLYLCPRSVFKAESPLGGKSRATRYSIVKIE